MKARLRCFKPVVDERSRVLILGSMPGPVALKRRQYYGFPGNQFWALIAAVLERPKPESYPEKLRMLKRERVALWDTLASCVRPGASDSRIRRPELNDIPGLLRRHPGIRAVFVNGRSAELYLRPHGPLPGGITVLCLPSSSPAYASLSFERKLARWRAIRDWL